jgi:hypothetical protein
MLIEQHQVCIRLATRRPQQATDFSIKLRKSHGGRFFHELIQTHAPRTRKGLEPPMLGIR